MDESLPPLAFEELSPSLQALLGSRIAERIQEWIREAEMSAREHLGRNRERLERLAEGLLRSETLHRPAILAILGEAEEDSR